MSAPFCMRISVARLALALAVSLAGAGAGRAQELYTVDHMLAVEEIGKVRFTSDGESLIFERYGPFEAQSNFGRPRVSGEFRSRIYAVQTQGDASPEPLFEQSPKAGYTIQGFSPDGRRLLFGRTAVDGLTFGIVAAAGGEATAFDLSPDVSGIFEPVWIGDDKVVVEALGPGKVATVAALEMEWMLEHAALWRQRNEGRAPTASQIGSGRFDALPTPTGNLVLADANTGTARPIASGAFTFWYASAVGHAVAALKEERLGVDPDALIEHGANIGGIERRLVVTDVETGETKDVCPGCDVLLSSLNWSASSPRLVFAARDAGQDWSQANFRIYDHRQGVTRTVELGSLSPHATRPVGARIVMRATWIGDRLAVLARPAAGSEQAEPRADWYILGESVPRNLTTDFPGAVPELVAITEDALVVLHEGEAWAIDATGARRNLTAEVAEPIMAWRDPSGAGQATLSDLRPAERLVLETRDSGRASQLVIVDIEAGSIARIIAPSTDSRFLAVAPEQGAAAVTAIHDNITTLSIVRADGASRPVVHLNEHLRGVVGGTPVRIDHQGPDGDARISWLLLPPGHAPGERHPTVVSVYPGAVGRSRFTGMKLDDVHALNGHLLASHGYAVLYPSLPVDYADVPRDPLDGLVDEVFSAVDAGVAQGFIDPGRLAVQGHSYGGYATGGLIGLTDRFRSAVAMAGVYDLISNYGQFDIRYWMDNDASGLPMFAVSHLETSQGGMGAAPWDDPQRYLRNSPLMHVRDITTPVLLVTGDRDYISTTQTEEFFTALTRLNKDAVFLRYYGESHVLHSPANIRDLWERLFAWYDQSIGSRESGKSSDILPSGA